MSWPKRREGTSFVSLKEVNKWRQRTQIHHAAEPWVSVGGKSMNTRLHVRSVWQLLSVAVLTTFGLTGCATYVTPGGGVAPSALADWDIEELLEREPASPFPARMTVVRVQAPGAFEMLLYELEKTWAGVIQQHAGHRPPSSGDI